MSLDDPKAGRDEAAPEPRRNAREYYHDKKDRVFVRPIQGHYNLTDELKRLRAMPRVRRRSRTKSDQNRQRPASGSSGSRTAWLES